MYSFIEKYCGRWKSKSGYRLSIVLNPDETVSVSFYRAGEAGAMLRPWLNNTPAVGMLGKLDSESGGSLDIELSDNINSFCLNLYFQAFDDKYQKLCPSIIRYEEEAFLEQYYELLGPLDNFEKC